ncbi:MAG: YigZ family protein [Spirochaetales bacterium]|nr:YigZ family protein [Spirochaetales bacterium]
MFIPLGTSSEEFSVKKSRFIGSVHPVDSPEEARSIVKEVRKENPGCRHVVHAFIIGRGAEIQGMSDDGEPSGTAGKPVLEVLKGSGLTGTLITVVRYFGGVKLGTGGLVKAYTQSAQLAVGSVKIRELIRRRAFALTIPYPLYEGFKKMILPLSLEILNEDFGSEIDISGILPFDNQADMEQMMADLTAGKTFILWGEELY